MNRPMFAGMTRLDLLRARNAARVQLHRAALGNPGDPAERAAAEFVRARLGAIDRRLRELGVDLETQPAEARSTP